MAGFRAVLACMAVSAIVGCATVPEYREDSISTADIVRNIKCELRDAAWSDPANAWAQNWDAVLTLSLIVDHNGAIDTDSSWLFPLNGGATFVVGLTSMFGGQGVRTERVEFKERLALLNTQPIACEVEDPGRYARLAGRLGISDLFERVGLMKEVAAINPRALDYNLDFYIRKNATTTPKFNVIPIGKEKTFTGSLKWTGSRTDQHSLKIALLPHEEPAGCEFPIPGSDKCATPVYIIKDQTKGASPRAPEDRRSGAPPPPAVSRGREAPVRAPSAAPRALHGIDAAQEQRLDNAASRNLLRSIDDQLRRQGLGN